MKKFLLLILFSGILFSAVAQNKTHQKTSKVAKDTTAFPIRGIFKINETSFTLFKNLELWVFDANDKEILYISQNIPTSEAYNDVVDRMIDREYTALMMKHGHVIDKKASFPIADITP